MNRNPDPRIYFIRPIGFASPIKIGTATNIARRLKSLHIYCPFPLEVLAELAGGEALEARLHEHFLSDHRGYEWFSWSPALQCVIDSVNAGTFDISDFPEAKSPKPLQRGKRSDRSPERRPWAVAA